MTNQDITLQDVLNRLEELPDNDRAQWLDTIYHVYNKEYTRRKYMDGLEQGRVEAVAEMQRHNLI